jgi:hypothetical protein
MVGATGRPRYWFGYHAPGSAGPRVWQGGGMERSWIVPADTYYVTVTVQQGGGRARWAVYRWASVECVGRGVGRCTDDAGAVWHLAGVAISRLEGGTMQGKPKVQGTFEITAEQMARTGARISDLEFWLAEAAAHIAEQPPHPGGEELVGKLRTVVDGREDVARP